MDPEVGVWQEQVCLSRSHGSRLCAQASASRGHGDEYAISQAYPLVVPATSDCGQTVVKLNRKDSVDHLEVHVLRAAKMMPLEKYVGSNMVPLDLLYYMVCLVAHASLCSTNGYYGLGNFPHIGS